MSKYIYYIREYSEKASQRQYIDNLIKGINTADTYTIEDTDNISPYVFEELIAQLFRNMGYQASATKKSGDQGVDIIASRGNTRIAIQAKCYPKSVVGNNAIQEVVAGMRYYGVVIACVITNSTFSQSAINLAKANNVQLWDRSILQALLLKFPISKK